jgi:hypothetical protein
MPSEFLRFHEAWRVLWGMWTSGGTTMHLRLPYLSPLFALSMAAALSCRGSAESPNNTQLTDHLNDTPGDAGGPVIPLTFFGMHESHPAACGDVHPLFHAPAGTFRTKDACQVDWADMNPDAGVFMFDKLDELLAALKSVNGIDDVFISLGGTPPWVSGDPGDDQCDGAEYGENGRCHPPRDLNPDGTGTDEAWLSFVNVLLLHVTDADYLQTHARIRAYEIWNEYGRSDTVSTYTCGTKTNTCSYRGTFAQMLRMTEDLRCIAKGQDCQQDPFPGLDPQALVMEGNAGPSMNHGASHALQNFLYCNDKPPAESECNYGDAGSAAVDAISGHPYFINGDIPETVISDLVQQRTLLSSGDLAKPYFAGEGGWTTNDVVVSDPGVQAGFVPRWFLSLLISNVQHAYWYEWDGSGAKGWGGLWAPEMEEQSPLTCVTPDDAGGYYCTGGVAYLQMVQWLAGANIAGYSCPGDGGCTDPSPGIFAFDIVRDGGYQGEIVWDSTPTSSCPAPVNPQCGYTAWTAPAYGTQWHDLSGTTHVGVPHTVGAEPVLIDSTCPNGETFCDNACIPQQDCCTSFDCPGGAICESGRCILPP